ncbi:MAG: alpha-E domain-containing protein [Roseibacillus sp.]
MMLSRVAESLMWLSRYIERAKSLARLVEVADQLALDYRHPNLDSTDLFWKPILQTYGYELGAIEKLKTKEDFHRYLLVDNENYESVFRNISFARENARGAREQLSSELWEVLNELYLWCKEQSKSKSTINPAIYGARVRQGCLQIRGLIEEMMPREEAWCFLRLGTMLERADQSSRLLDLRYFMPGEGDEEGKAFEPYVWLCIMRGCGSGSQRGFGNTETDWPRLNEALVFSSVFPQSILYCVREVNNVLHNLSGSALGRFNNEAEQSCGRFLAQLQLDAFSGEIEGELHDFLDEVQKNLNTISENINEAYTYTGDQADEKEEAENVTETTQTQSQS